MKSFVFFVLAGIGGLAVLGLLLFGGMGLAVGGFLAQGGSQRNTGEPGTAEAAAGLQRLTRLSPAAVKAGETAHVGYWSYRVQEAHWQPYVIGLGGSLDEPSARFLILQLTARNDDVTESALPPIKLVDEVGRISSQSSAGEFTAGVFDSLKRVNRGVSTTGFAIFDVAPGHTYRALFSGGFQSDRTLLAELPSEHPAGAAEAPEGSSPNPSAATAAPVAVSIVRVEDGIRFHEVSGEWIRMDMPEVCSSPDPALTGGFPEVCKLGR